MGDNRDDSQDSRFFGPISEDLIVRPGLRDRLAAHSSRLAVAAARRGHPGRHRHRSGDRRRRRPLVGAHVARARRRGRHRRSRERRCRAGGRQRGADPPRRRPARRARCRRRGDGARPGAGARTPAWIHGADGLGDVGLDPAPFGPIDERASGLLARLVDERPGEVAVIALGPLSNLAAVIRADPTWAGAVGRLVVMGGSVVPGGNATPAAEANIAHDPDAAAVVLGAALARAATARDAGRHPPGHARSRRAGAGARAPHAGGCLLRRAAALLPQRRRHTHRRVLVPRPAGRPRDGGSVARARRAPARRRPHGRRPRLGGVGGGPAQRPGARARVLPVAGDARCRRHALRAAARRLFGG